MSKMREAFEKWVWEDVLHRQSANASTFEAGYQAAIAAVKEGGPACIGYDFVDGKSGPVIWTNGCPKVGEMLYKLPEDV